MPVKYCILNQDKGCLYNITKRKMKAFLLGATIAPVAVVAVVVVVSGMRSVGRCVIMVAVTSMVSVVPQMVRARMVVVHPAIPVHPRV